MRAAPLILMWLLALPPIASGADEGEATLATIGAQLSRAAVVRGTFVQTRSIVGLSHPLISRGHFVVARGVGVLWDTETPFPQQLGITASGLHERREDGSNAFLGRGAPAPALKEVSRVLGALFEADLAVLGQYFSAQGELVGQAWRVQLQPRSAELAQIFASVTMHGDHLVRVIELRESNGDSTLIRFDELRTDEGLTQPESDALAL